LHLPSHLSVLHLPSHLYIAPSLTSVSIAPSLTSVSIAPYCAPLQDIILYLVLVLTMSSSPDEVAPVETTHTTFLVIRRNNSSTIVLQFFENYGRLSLFCDPGIHACVSNDFHLHLLSFVSIQFHPCLSIFVCSHLFLSILSIFVCFHGSLKCMEIETRPHINSRITKK